MCRSDSQRRLFELQELVGSISDIPHICAFPYVLLPNVAILDVGLAGCGTRK